MAEIAMVQARQNATNVSATTIAAKSILLVESDSAQRNALHSVLSSAGYDLIDMADGGVALQMMGRHTPDLVILDVQHCGGDAMDLCRQLRADRRCRQIPLILLSQVCDEADRVLGLELGADDFLAMPIGRHELVARIKSLLRRSNPPPSEFLHYGELVIDVAGCRAQFREQSIPLTATEFRILHYLVESPTRVHSRERIMDAAHIDAADTMERSVDPHVNAIRRKLGAGASIIETVRGFGYRLR